jgi:carbonic anhydrase
VFANLPKNVCDKIDNVRIEFTKLLPKPLGAYFTYTGSLTTPPCTQDVSWYVLGATQTMLQSDWEKLHARGMNARPIQVNQPPLPVTYIRPQ